MSKTYIENEQFDKSDFNISPLPKGEYEHCTFINCNFSVADISNINFTTLRLLAAT